MSISAQHLRRYVIVPALKAIGLHSLAAENLVLGTACQESGGGQYLAQLGGGPALGIFQMEPATHDDIWRHFLAYDATLANRVINMGASGLGVPPPSSLMTWNLRYAAAMCRIHYRRVSAPLPDANDIWALAEYWKRYYNTQRGAGTPKEFVSNWRKLAD